MTRALRRSTRSSDKAKSSPEGSNDTERNERNKPGSIKDDGKKQSGARKTSESLPDGTRRSKSGSTRKLRSSSRSHSEHQGASSNISVDTETTNDVKSEQAEAEENSERGNQPDNRSQEEDAASAKESREKVVPNANVQESKKSRFDLTPEVLARIKSNLQVSDSLDEDGIAQKVVQTHRIVTDRTHQVVLPNVDDDSEDERDEFRRVYQQEEDLALLQHNFKNAVRGVDKKATNWLRNALGMKRRHYHFHTQSTLEDGESEDDEDETPKRKTTSRRLTRGMARTTRIRKREERFVRENQGLHALLDAVKDLEDAHGPFPLIETPSGSEEEDEEEKEKEPPRKKPKTTKSPTIQKEREEAKRKTSKPHQPLFALVPRKTTRKRRSAKDNDKTVRVTRILVDGRRIRPPGEAGDARPRKIQSKKRKSPTDSYAMNSQPVDDTEASPKRTRPILVDSYSDDDESEDNELPPGRLFGKLSKSSRYPDVMSLSLLDWNRRQQWTPQELDENLSNRIKFPPHVVDAGVDESLPAWETVNPIPRVPREPSTTMEPCRRRHSNATYAKWCNRLINFINGSGRMFAKAEFFYSDIDRSWYNSNEFQRDVAQLGVPPSMKLTRAEWRLVRRNLPRHPRRFSRRFVRDEFDRLNQYRRHVRELQNDPARRLKVTMDYDIPARIRVGATVTAYNKRAHLLHRGIVLSHDERRQAYLVQFERKELGFELCPDSDVASHGVPEIMRAAPSIALDGTDYFSFSNNEKPGSLVYGTSYSQLTEYSKGQEKEPSISRLIRCKNSSALLAGDGALSAIRLKTPRREDDNQDALIDKVAEHEMLVKLIGFIDTALIRKDLLLKAMNECHIEFDAYSKNISKTDSISRAESLRNTSDFRDHYSWLHANLVVTNQSLEAALVHMQVMYGGRYASTPCGLDDAQAKKLELDRILERDLLTTGKHVLGEDHSDQEVDAHSVQWTRSLLRESALTAQSMQSNLSNKKWGEPSMHPSRDRFLKHRLAGAGQLLLAMNYGCGSYVETSRHERSTMMLPHQAGPRVIGHALSVTLDNLAPKQLRVGNHETLKEFDSDRLAAYQELQDAMVLLEAEMVAVHRASETFEFAMDG